MDLEIIILTEITQIQKDNVACSLTGGYQSLVSVFKLGYP